MPLVIPTHQGRAAEKIIFTILGGKGKYFISNTLFDTTRANIEFSGAEGIDLVCEEGKHPTIPALFKGNMDVEALKKTILKLGATNIPMVIMTITNNSGGGQPVSMRNIKEASQVCKENKIPFLLMPAVLQRILTLSSYGKTDMLINLFWKLLMRLSPTLMAAP